MRKHIEGVWHPLIDKEKCLECDICYQFCPRGVYEKRDDIIKVQHPDRCVDRCHGCEWRCPEGAISFPEPFSLEYAKRTINYYSFQENPLPLRLVKFISNNQLMTVAEIHEHSEQNGNAKTED